MRVFLLAVSIFLCVSLMAQSSVSSSPSSPSKGGSVSHDQSRPPQSEGQQQKADEHPDLVCNGCSITKPEGAAKENDAQQPKESGLYRAYLWATIFGVGGAFIGLLVLWRQTTHTGKQVSALMNAERAILLLDGVPQLQDGKLIHPSFTYHLVNVGKTPAILVESYGKLQIGDASEPTPPNPSVYDVTKVPYPLHGSTIITTGAQRQHTEVGQSSAVGREDTKAIFETLEKCFWACGFFIYWDVFGREYEQRFCYRFFVWEGLERFYLAGPVEYNCTFEREKKTYQPKYQPKG